MMGPHSDDRHGTDSRPIGRFGGPGSGSNADRAVSPVIGAILMFALALALLALLQTTAIPALNENLEFQHNDRVRSDLGEVDGAVDRVAASGNGETVAIGAGLRYPPRLFFVNPPPASGTVRTTDAGTVAIDNAAAAGETGDYWNGTPQTFGTRALEFVPDYNEYGGAPTTVVEPWVRYDRFDERAVTRSEQDLVDGRRLDLVALEGERSVSRADDVSVDVDPTSAPARTVTVSDRGEPITLTLPSRLSEDEWRDLLAAELDPAGDSDDDRYVTSVDCQAAPPDPCGQVTLTLEEGATYELRLGAVAVGSGASPEGAAYLTDIEGTATAIPESGRQRLVVEARDRFDNPVSGVTVTGSLAGDGTVRPVEPVTDAEGRATFVYEAPADVDGTRDVEATLRFGDGSARTVPFDVRVMDRGNGDASSVAPSATITDVVANTGGNDRYDVTLNATDVNGDLAGATFELRDPDTGTLIERVERSLRGDADTASARLTARGTDRRRSYRIVATVTDGAGNVASDERIVSG
ncbi:Ig-like domain-containing protein [Natrinema sp. H-ect1]|uniref:Ig-like domain-containing protein n=1 Tax=Natrinema sp. H-ect1 TaxID=3242700 RepID=UPI00359E29B7